MELPDSVIERLNKYNKSKGWSTFTKDELTSIIEEGNSFEVFSHLFFEEVRAISLFPKKEARFWYDFAKDIHKTELHADGGELFTHELSFIDGDTCYTILHVGCTSHVSWVTEGGDYFVYKEEDYKNKVSINRLFECPVCGSFLYALAGDIIPTEISCSICGNKLEELYFCLTCGNQIKEGDLHPDIPCSNCGVNAISWRGELRKKEEHA